MNRARGLVLGVLALVTVLTACGGGGGSEYDFGGVWSFEGQAIESTHPDIPVGVRFRDTATIAQEGTSIDVTFPGLPMLVGTCDAKGGTFHVEGGSEPRLVMDGSEEGEETVTGELLMGLEGRTVLIRYVMTRGPGPKRAGGGGPG